ncbi:MAG: hypothetical protein LV481_07760 [Methylacidiphilales bacterium]|nr:hypothetical protein [Candidatus Methylacidiphilales bacterium]
MPILSSPMSYFSHPASSARWKNVVGLCAVILWLAASGSILVGQTTNGASANPPASSTQADEETFGRYLVDHQDDLAPFFNENGDEFVSQAAPLILGLLGKIMFFTLVSCWVLDVALIRWFSIRFAPAFSRIRRALIYATGRLVLSVLFYALLGLAIVFVSDMGHEAIVIALLFLAFLLIELAVQTGWIHYLYSTPVPKAFLCYLGIFVVHIFTGVLVSAPILAGHATMLVKAYVDINITPKLQAAADTEKKELATITSVRDALKAQVDDAQKKIAENTNDQQQLQQQIDQEKNSDGYLFSRIVKLRAQGHLEAARDQITDLLSKFPNSPLTDAMKTQLAGIDSDLATQAAQKQQAQADAARADAQARAALLARAAQGEATLSEMRLALVGKKTADITALFGPPTATDSDRWGYSRQMIINPMTQDKFGLTVYFSDGIVQGVDYYYSTGGGGTQ